MQLDDDFLPCACGRPFLPDVDLYHAHVQTAEHQRWRREVVELGRPLTDDERDEIMPVILYHAPKREAA